MIADPLPMVHPAFTLTECDICLLMVAATGATRTRSPYATRNGVPDVPCADRCSVAAAKQYGRTESRLICCRRDREDRSCHPDREAAQAVAEFRLGHWARAAPLATRGLRLRR